MYFIFVLQYIVFENLKKSNTMMGARAYLDGCDEQ